MPGGGWVSWDYAGADSCTERGELALCFARPGCIVITAFLGYFLRLFLTSTTIACFAPTHHYEKHHASRWPLELNSGLRDSEMEMAWYSGSMTHGKAQ